MEILKSTLPNVYASILEKQPARSEWEAFHFGGCVSSGGGRRLGRVIHPVREGLRNGQRGDALLSFDPLDNQLSDNVTTDATNAISPKDRVSPCQPAHLAQNKFVSLLLREAQQHNQGKHLHFDEEIINIQESSTLITIHTSKCQSYQTRFLLACDGVHSFARRYCNIEMRGEPALQHMMNVHFRTNESLSDMLMRRTENNTNDSDNFEESSPGAHDQAMLHFVYNPRLVGAFVCHDGRAGEWVLQIPYFPPYQSPEVDFSPEKVKGMISYGLLGRNHTQSLTNTYCARRKNEEYDLDILSIRSWIMSSLVAERYINKSQNVILVGDAAHSFPPAGGFGMNTGLQDAHNLAWRLSLVFHREERRKHPCTESSASDGSVSKLLPQQQCNSILSMYEQDRKPVAIQNAALSARNYQRTLRIAKACYLDAQHPQLLMTMLGSPPMSFLPLEARQEMFRRLVNVAMMPLGSLLNEKDSIHASQVGKNVTKILESGGSLPLVFPRYEIGFHYNSEHNQVAMSSDDTAGYHPRIRVGHRFPHIDVKVLSSGPLNTGWSVLEAPHQQLRSSANSTFDGLHISLVDISSQLKRLHMFSAPFFTLLALGSIIDSSSAVQTAATDAMNKWNVPLILLNVLREESNWNDKFILRPVDSADSTYNSCRVEYCVDFHRALYQLASNELASSGSDSELNALIMVRPDGHVANALVIDQASSQMELEGQVTSFVERGLSTCLGQPVS